VFAVKFYDMMSIHFGLLTLMFLTMGHAAQMLWMFGAAFVCVLLFAVTMAVSLVSHYAAENRK
jgi:hypothetical protein